MLAVVQSTSPSKVVFAIPPPQPKEVALVVPVKAWPQAKQRLRALLNPQERMTLVELMLTHVLERIQRLSLPVRYCVLTSYLPAMKLARSLGFEVLAEIHQRSENDSLQRAHIDLIKSGAKGVLRLPADLPLLQVRDLHALLDPILAGAKVVLSPSADRTGTNALYRNPPNLFVSQFGENSLRTHLQSARACGITVVRVERPGLALDIDEPADLARWLKEAPAPSACIEFLQTIHLAQRLAKQAG